MLEKLFLSHNLSVMPCLEVTGRHVESEEVSSDVAHALLLGDLLAPLVDDHAQLDLVVNLVASKGDLIKYVVAHLYYGFHSITSIFCPS